MRYYVNMNQQANGDHEVHTLDCTWLPDSENRIYLGDYIYCSTAVSEAKNTTVNRMVATTVQIPVTHNRRRVNS